MLLEMRRDLRPLCPKHLTAMDYGVLPFKMPEDGIYPKDAYGCISPDCGYHFASLNGYFTIWPGESINRDFALRVACSNCTELLYLAALSADQSTADWRCGNLDCDGLRQTAWPLPQKQATAR